jgi:hypothetical protein
MPRFPIEKLKEDPMNDTAKTGDAPVVDLELKIDLEIEELEKIVAPGVDHNHNETLVSDEDSELDA